MKTHSSRNSTSLKTQGFLYRTTLSLLIFSLISLDSTYAFSRGDSDRPDRENFNAQNRSNGIRHCEEWYVEYGIDGGSSTLPWYDLKSTQNSYIDLIFGGQTPDLDKVVKMSESMGSGDKKEQFKKFLSELVYCEAYRAATETENYHEKHRDIFANSSGSGANGQDTVNTQMMQCMQQTDQAQAQQCIQQAQQSGGISCQHEGWETHDYLACKKLATFTKGFTVGKAAMELQQTVRVGNAQVNAQEDLLQKQRTEEGIGMSDTLAVQRDSLEQQGNMAYEMAAYNAAKAGILLAMISSFPNKEDMFKRCTENFSNDQQSSFVTNLSNSIAAGGSEEARAFFSEVAGGEGQQLNIASLFEEGSHINSLYSNNPDPKNTQHICETIIQENSNFFLNQEMLDKVKEVAMGAGLEAIANGAQGALLKKQAGIVDDAIGDIEEFEKPEFEQAGFEPSLTSECVVDPEAEGCITFDGLTNSGFGSQSFGTSATGSANLGSGSLGGDDDSGVSSASATDRDLLPKSFGSVTVGTPNDTSFSDGIVSPGSVKPGKGGGGAGGGGGGGAGGASLPGGGGGGQGAGATAAAGSKGSSAIKVGSVGSGLGRVSGGRGSIGKKVSKSDNPFAKLLGKSKSSGATLNFRGPAQIGKKKGSLFERISTRYKAVSDADKLLKYEATKK